MHFFYSQPDARTIEGVLFDALVRVGAVSSDNADDSTKVSLGRAARTDAGVHAAGNIVSMKLITQIPGVPDVVEAVNELLPPEIRVWRIIRVQNSFNARTCARFLSLVTRMLNFISIDPAIVASIRTSSHPTFSYRRSPAVDCSKLSTVRLSRCPAHHLRAPRARLLMPFILSGRTLPLYHRRTMIYKGSAVGALEQKTSGDYGRSSKSSRALATSTISP